VAQAKGRDMFVGRYAELFGLGSAEQAAAGTEAAAATQAAPAAGGR
jgi:hypothetical protein